jgi:5-bromo-4-chloroindolyl phosphate hydrolysis protein
MGFIPLFLTVGGACLLFFLTVKNTMQRKLNTQRELLSKIGLAHPEIGLILGEISDPDTVLERLRKASADEKISKMSLEVIRELKINKYQYNRLIKKAPYNWVAKIAGFQSI